MYLRKIVGSTVDKMTLSYTERHLKEAIDEEYAIPTTVLSVVAEKSYNEYNVKTIIAFLDKSFKMNMKEWKKFRNLMKIIEYLLKFGSPELVGSLRKYTSEVRMLQNYNFMEGGSDKGTSVREVATVVVNLLNNPRELDYIREESQRIRDKYTGISSDHTDGGYKHGSYDSSYTGLSNDKYSAPNYSNYREPPATYKKDVFDMNVVPKYNNPQSYSDSRYTENPGVPDIFAGGSSKLNTEDFNNRKVPDLFANVKRKDVKPVDLLGSQGRSDAVGEHIEGFGQNSGDIFGIERPNIFPQNERRAEANYSTSTNYYEKNTVPVAAEKYIPKYEEPQAKIDIFAMSKPQKPSNPQPIPDLFEVIPQTTSLQPQPLPVNNSNLLQNDIFGLTHEQPNPGYTQAPVYSAPAYSAPSSLFSGMALKKQASPELQPVSKPVFSEPIAGNQNFSLESLSLNFVQPTSGSMVQSGDNKYKFNLIQTEEKPKPAAPNKGLNPAEFEAKLFDFQLN